MNTGQNRASNSFQTSRDANRQERHCNQANFNKFLGGQISPDGKYFLYADTKGLRLSVIDTGEIHDIPLPTELQDQIWDATWFPDGARILLTSFNMEESHVIWEASIFGGNPRKLRTGSQAAVVSPQGSSIAFVSGHYREIWVMGPNGENPRRVIAIPSGSFEVLAWSPTGERLAYIRRTKPTDSEFGGSIETVAVNGGLPNTVLSDPRLESGGYSSSLVWLRDGRLIFALKERLGQSDANLWSIRTDPQTGKASGMPERITNWHGFAPMEPSVSKDGSRLAVTKGRDRDDVYIGELKENGIRLESPTRLTLSDSIDLPNAWTHDSSAILFASDRADRYQIYRQKLDQDMAKLLIQEPDDEQGAELTPDGAWILYWATAHGELPVASMRLMRSSTSGESPQQVLETPYDEQTSFECPFHANTACVLSRREQDHRVLYALDPLKGLGKEVARVDVPTGEWGISPDGTHIALVVIGGIRVIDLSKGTESDLKVPWVIWSLRWAADGRALFAAAQSKNYVILRIELDGKTRVLLDRGRYQWIGIALPSPDGRYLAFAQQSFDTNAWLLENF